VFLDLFISILYAKGEEASLYAKGEVASTHRVDGSDRPSTQGLLRSDRGHRRYQHEEFRA
jgi:hypothetical protein